MWCCDWTRSRSGRWWRWFLVVSNNKKHDMAAGRRDPIGSIDLRWQRESTLCVRSRVHLCIYFFFVYISYVHVYWLVYRYSRQSAHAQVFHCRRCCRHRRVVHVSPSPPPWGTWRSVCMLCNVCMFVCAISLEKDTLALFAIYCLAHDSVDTRTHTHSGWRMRAFVYVLRERRAVCLKIGS